MKKGGSRPILTIPRIPTAAVTEFRFVGLDGNQLAVAGARALGIASDSVEAADLTATPKKAVSVTVLGTQLLEIGVGGCTAGTYGTSEAVTAKGITAGAGNAKNCIFLETGAAGDFVEVQVGDFGVA